MEKAFNTSSVLFVHRLIIHEKAHFLWAHLFDETLKQDWILLGGWYRDANDPDGWSTTKQPEGRICPWIVVVSIWGPITVV